MRSFILIIFLTISYSLFGQDVLYYVNSGFETIEDQGSWTATTDDAFLSWEYQTGGQDLNPPIAKQKTKNAFLYKNVTPQKTGMLTSKVLDIGEAGRPLLKFWHAQYASVWGNDELRVLFRKDEASPWETVRTYINPVNSWTERFIDIFAIDEKYKTDSFQFAFEATVGNGWGVVIDSVTVEETETLPVFVKSTIIEHFPHVLIPSGAPDIPVTNLIFKIYGNQGEANLKNLTVRPVGDGVMDLEPSGFKLFLTQDILFTPNEYGLSTQIASGSLSGGVVQFTNINKELSLGNNYVWLTVSLKDNIDANSTVRFNFDAESIELIDTLVPGTTYAPSEYQTLAEVVLFDDFEGGSSIMTLEGDFEIAPPEGKKIGSSYDPSAAYSGTKILGTDLTDDGAYLTGIDSTVNSYYAYTDNIDLTYYINLGLFMHRKFDFGPNTLSVIDVSSDGGNNWLTIWDRPSDQISDPYWEEWYNTSFSEFVSKEDSVQIRIGIKRNTTDLRPGFNIDNLGLIGEHLGTDVGVSSIITPYDDCIGCNNDTVMAVFRNFAEGPAPDTIPVFFGLWGIDSVLISDTIFGGIPQDDSIVFTFSSLADFPIGDIYAEFIVGINLSDDQDARNDTLTKRLLIQKSLFSPDLTDFEDKSGLWFKKEESSWICKDMTLTIPTDPSSPNIWVLSSTGNYDQNDLSYIESNCYNFSDEIRHLVEFEYWSNTEEFKDGARLEYSADHAENWNVIYDDVHGIDWGWYSDTVEALGSRGWSGHSNWKTARAILPADMDTATKAKFRLLWASDATTAHTQGFAINNFSVYEAPIDVGISTIEIPKDTCQFTYPDEMLVWVKNYGYNDLKTNDTMIIGYDFESDAAIIDTFLLASNLIPGDSVVFNITTGFDLSAVGAYQLKAYTLIEDDPFFYGTNNDTLVKTFDIWPLPLTGLLDTISSRQPDTLLIEPVFDADYTYLWGDNTTTPTYDVQVPGTYYLTVTEVNNGCKAYDSSFVELLFNDVGIDSIISPQSSCDPSTGNTVEVLIRNFGTDSLRINDKILLYYEFDGEPVIKDSITLTEALYSGATIPFEFTGSIVDMNLEKDYSLKAFTDYGGDTISYNDTIERTFTIFGNPELNLGADTIINGLSHNLIVDPSFDSYKWENGDTNSTRLIDTSGYYSLAIIDQNGCPASDDIDIWFRIRDLRVQSLLSPVSSCNREGMDVVTVRVENYGSDTIYIADDIFVSYKLEDGTRESESFNISQLLPGETDDHSFSQNVDITAFDTYSFNLTASTVGDMRPANDTLIDEVVSNTNPVVDLGVEDTDIHYVSELVLDAGAGTNFAYLWQDGSTNQTYTVTDITNVNVLVTDTETGCSGSDEAFVYLDILDYTVTDVDIDASACLGDYNDVRVTLLNNGNLPRGGAEITLDYSLSGIHLFTEIYERADNWQDGVSYIHNTQGTISLSELGSSELIISITSDGDLRPENDDYINAMVVDNNPEVDLGGDRQEVDFPHTLDAGSGHAAYLWSTGETTSSISATSAGTYSVTVTGTTSCQTIKSVYIDTELALSPNAEEEMSISIYPNPASEFITVEALFENAGNYTLEIYNSQNTIIVEHEINSYEFKEEFYVGGLTPGLYFIRFRKEDAYHISKMIIQ